jgi:hypothetical protein
MVVQHLASDIQDKLAVDRISPIWLTGLQVAHTILGITHPIFEVTMNTEADGVHGEIQGTSGRQVRLTSLSSCAG